MNLSHVSRIAAVLAVAAVTTLTATSASASTPAPAPGRGQAIEAQAHRSTPYAWATRRGSTIGIYGIDMHGQSFTVGGTVRLALFRDSGPRGIPVWTKDATARRITGRPGGSFNVTTGLLDCTAYGYAKDSTMMVWDIATNTWSNKVRVSTACDQ
ncbi:hypothetical protein [Streptomyces sp. 3214.6]|uniref:hypothetical protein n=1 Tax=Streptomyces sp. 3214.6 TaxID=1882757 RepID=UPI00090CB7F8|nr:hypothetical protein [Streptomyces sp. 3214.6]SHI24477.1 hypothetical protein SAMN05444521_6050 [Streptomyces sp. 3214.6]